MAFDAVQLLHSHDNGDGLVIFSAILIDYLSRPPPFTEIISEIGMVTYGFSFLRICVVGWYQLSLCAFFLEVSLLI